jgi:transcription elongation factor GreA
MTPQGYEKLQAELKHMKSVERPRCIQAIAEARAHGDLSENAEYDAAKHAQSLLEGRIKDYEARMSLAEVIDPAAYAGSDKVVFGATVELEDTEEGKKVVYQIVGEHEADVKEGRISVTSPIARALVGKTVGDTVVVQAPGGKREYDIVDVKYA